MALLPQLLRLARQLQQGATTMVPQSPVAAVLQHATGSAGAAAASGAARATPPSLLLRRRLSGQPHRRTHVVAAAGRRGNVFLDGGAAADSAGLRDENGDPSAASLFDSSRFNADSNDEDDEAVALVRRTPRRQLPPPPSAQLPGMRRGRGGSSSGMAADGSMDEDAASAAALSAAGSDGGMAADVVLPPARGVRVRSAEFVKSSTSVEQCPPPRLPEFAVIGRSNVGKSSLINMLTGRNALAMVSKTPGKTRLINHFIINDAWYLVDLPGYGYARMSKDKTMEWNAFTRQYFTERETLVSVLLLIDASIPPMPLDISCATWFVEAEVPFTIVFTKLDKRKKGEPPAEENIAAFEAQVAEVCGYAPPSVLTSSRSGRGRTELLSHVAQLREFFNKTHHGMW